MKAFWCDKLEETRQARVLRIWQYNEFRSICVLKGGRKGINSVAEPTVRIAIPDVTSVCFTFVLLYVCVIMELLLIPADLRERVV